MYLYLGQNTLVPKKSVVGIFDMDNATSSHVTRKSLNIWEKKGMIVNVSDDIPKSFVICSDGGETRVYLSQLSSQTLLKRSGMRITDSV